MKADISIFRLVPHAWCALKDNLLVRAGEQVILLWDETVSHHLLDAFRIAANRLSLTTITLTYQPLAYRPIMEYGLFAGRSLLPPINFPRIIKEALLTADAFVFLCSDTEILFCPDLREILNKGKRGIFLPYLDSFNAERMLFTSKRQVEEQFLLVNRVADLFQGEGNALITSSEGTNLHLKFGQYKVLRRKGVTNPGELMFLPAGNVARVPDDNSANGTLVVDRTICANDYKELHEPIILEISDGQVVQINGGMEAKLLREFLRGLNDPRAYHLTELAVGTNPLCKWSGIGAPSEDTHVLGTVAFALGCDTHIGGNVPAPVHIDMTMRYPSLLIGNHKVVADGRLLVD